MNKSDFKMKNDQHEDLHEKGRRRFLKLMGGAVGGASAWVGPVLPSSRLVRMADCSLPPCG